MAIGIMNEKYLLIGITIVLGITVFFIESTITGHVVEDRWRMCDSDEECNCCILHEDDGLGLCMDSCESAGMLCKQDSDCTEGRCCISEGMFYGLCSDDCGSAYTYTMYIEHKTLLEEPKAAYDPSRIIIVESLLIMALIISFILILVKWKKQ